jgi:hypothetical protein
MTIIAGFYSLLVSVQARELDRSFVRFAAGVAEEHAVHAGDFGEPRRELFLKRDLIEVGGVYEGRHLLLEGCSETRMRMSETAHRNACERVQIALALKIPEPCALAALESDREARVSVHHMRHKESLSNKGWERGVRETKKARRPKAAVL